MFQRSISGPWSTIGFRWTGRESLQTSTHAIAKPYRLPGRKLKLRQRPILPKSTVKAMEVQPDDLAERKHWGDYISAYEIALQRCSTQWAPWFIVPVDRKWYRDAAVARIVRATLEALDLTYPPEMRCRAPPTAGERHEGPAKDQRIADQPPSHRLRVTGAEESACASKPQFTSLFSSSLPTMMGPSAPAFSAICRIGALRALRTIS